MSALEDFKHIVAGKSYYTLLDENNNSIKQINFGKAEPTMTKKGYFKVKNELKEIPLRVSFECNTKEIHKPTPTKISPQETKSFEISYRPVLTNKERLYFLSLLTEETRPISFMLEESVKDSLNKKVEMITNIQPLIPKNITSEVREWLGVKDGDSCVFDVKDDTAKFYCFRCGSLTVLIGGPFDNEKCKCDK